MTAGARVERPAADVSALRRLRWSIGRELRENRSVCLAPLVVAAVFLVGFGISLVGLPKRMRAAAALPPAEMQAAIQEPYVMVAIVLMAVGLVVAVVYCLDALYGERRDRSILFWKSLPVSDRMTVLAKASVPILVIPLVTFAITATAQMVMLMASTVVLAAAGQSGGVPWTHVPLSDVVGSNFVHLVGFHGIQYAPLYGWLLLASAWAKRAPLLWAVLPPAAVGVVEQVVLGTWRFDLAVRDHIVGGPLSGESPAMTMDMLGGAAFLARPDPWIGLALTALFLWAATRLYRIRGPL
jgi:ABC-2 type transport system permease protein